MEAEDKEFSFSDALWRATKLMVKAMMVKNESTMTAIFKYLMENVVDQEEDDCCGW